jgi:uncharacterized membrane protein YkvA (DUF1232 family)
LGWEVKVSCDQYTKYQRHFSDSAFQKTLRNATSLLRGQAILLYLLLRDKETPAWVKASIIGVLGYFVCPIDLIPDFLPFGFTDDLSAVTALLCVLDSYITPEMRQRAKEY